MRFTHMNDAAAAGASSTAHTHTLFSRFLLLLLLLLRQGLAAEIRPDATIATLGCARCIAFASRQCDNAAPL